jgi:hypothetical protein
VQNYSFYPKIQIFLHTFMPKFIANNMKNSTTLKGCSCVLALSCVLLPLQAKKVDLAKAEKVATHYNYSTLKHTARATENSPLRSSVDEPLYYVFESDNNQGFVIVAADDVAIPVLGYSDNGNYDENNSNFKYWMDYLSQQIATAIEKNVPQSSATQALWNEFLNGQSNSLRAGTETNAVAPLLTTLWDQAPYYNDMCPLDNGELSVTGCLATAMAQIMNYHQWPKTRTVSIPGYTTKDKKIVIPAITGTTTFDWAHMTNTYSSSSSQTEITAVATLMYQAAVSMEMDFSAESSGASDAAAKPALLKYFDYSPLLSQVGRGNYSNTAWDALIKAEIDNKRPVLYSGQGTGGGHAFVCDGYDVNGYFHFNWGWGGYQNGYFVTTALNPSTGGAGSGDGGGYNNDQTILLNCQPKGHSTSAVTNLTAKQNRPDKLDLTWVAPNLGTQWSSLAGAAASASAYSDPSYEIAVLWTPEDLKEIANPKLTKVNFTAYTKNNQTKYTVVVYSRDPNATAVGTLVYSQLITPVITTDWQSIEVALTNPVIIDPNKEWIIGIRFEKGASASWFVYDNATTANPRNLYRTAKLWSTLSDATGKTSNFCFSAYFESSTNVTGYAVSRDNQPLATATGNYYTDETIEGDKTYNYCVTPIFNQSDVPATTECINFQTATQYNNPYPVKNLQVTPSGTHDVSLTWEKPDALPGSQTLGYITTPSSGYGYNKTDYSYAIRFNPEDMQSLAGHQLSKVSYFTNTGLGLNKNSIDLTIQIWKTSNEGTPELIKEQAVPGTDANFTNGWHEITLTTPLPIDIYESLYVGVGVHIKQTDPPVYAIPVDKPAISYPGKSDCVYINGRWQTLNAGCNVAVKAQIEPAGNVTSYLIARNNTPIATVSNPNTLTYTDVNPGIGTWNYSVTALYPTSKSNAISAQITVTSTDINNPATNEITAYRNGQTIYVSSTPENPIRQIAIYNTQGSLIYSNNALNAPQFTVTEKNNSTGIYIVKIVTENGVKTIKI